MRDSDTYLYILDEGRLDEAKKLILRQGRIRFGPPDEPTTTTINGLEDLERLERMSERVLTVTTWQELLDTP